MLQVMMRMISMAFDAVLIAEGVSLFGERIH